MNYAGVDPGLEGAMALLNQAGKVLALGPTPVLEHERRGKVYDLRAIARTLVKWARHAPVHLTVERLRALPATRRNELGQEVQLGGWQTNLHRGEARGWLWLVAGLQELGLQVTVQAVEPKEWQAELVKGLPAESNKARSLKAAALMFPGQDLRRSSRHRVPDHGIAEALLLAELGRRRSLGGTLFAQVAARTLTPAPGAAHTRHPTQGRASR